MVSFHLILMSHMYDIEMYLGDLVWVKTEGLYLLVAQLPPPRSGPLWTAGGAGPWGMGQTQSPSGSFCPFFISPSQENAGHATWPPPLHCLCIIGKRPSVVEGTIKLEKPAESSEFHRCRQETDWVIRNYTE